MSEPSFTYDIFLSHSTKDKAVVRDVAERLRKDGLVVWFDEWVIKPGDSIPAKIEEGLERSRVLVLCMSAKAFGSDWAQLEAGTFRFRDPLNKERRFIPLRLDRTPIKGSLSQFLFINWTPKVRKSEYSRLLEACRPPKQAIHDRAKQKIVLLETPTAIYDYAFSLDGKRALSAASDRTVRLWDVGTGRCLLAGHGHQNWVRSVAWSSDQRRALSTSHDASVRLWDMETGSCLHVFLGHSGTVYCVAWSPDQRRAITGAEDETVRLWDLETGHCLCVFQGHLGRVHSVAWTKNQRAILSSSDDNTARLWDAESGIALRVFEGHGSGVKSIALSRDQRRFLSGSDDKTVRLWDLDTGRCLRVFEGHTGPVNSVAWSMDQRHALSGSDDKNVRLWDMDTGRCMSVLAGHRSAVRTVAWRAGQRHAFSGDYGGDIRDWDLAAFVTQARRTETLASGAPPVLDQVQYTNAKVLLVGDTGVGKTGLARFLAKGIKDDERNSSTDGAWATQWILPHNLKKDGVEREIWLWDFAGQVDYRLVHQLFMDDTAAAVLVFNPQNENPYEGLGVWDRDLHKAARKPFAKLLVAGRVDRGGLVVSKASMEKFMKDRSFSLPLHETSAKTSEGCDKLRKAIVTAIAWHDIPETTSPILYQRMKQEILRLRDSGLVLIRLAELKQRIELTLGGENYELAELMTVIGLLAGPGMIQRLEFGGFILLRPEVLSRYAAAVVRKVRKHRQEMGCIREDEMLRGDLDYQDFERLPRDDEAVVLSAIHEIFISRAWCLRQSHDDTALLTFPSYFRRERKEQPSHPSVLVTYRFDGPRDEIYATLVVRLHHTLAFENTDLWKSAADFKTQTGAALGFALTREAEGTSRLEVYFEPDVDANSRVLFLRYVHDHLSRYAQNVVRLRHYACSNKKCDAFGQSFTDQAKIDKALAAGGKGKVFCSDCGKPISLHDAIEEKFDSAAVKEQVRELQIEGQAAIDNESGELMAMHHTGFIVTEAGQIYRGYTNSNQGIDGEIEFKDNQGRASGKRLYVQLKSGDSYQKNRQHDNAEVFQIKNPLWANYWQQQAYAVMLVIRTSNGEIRWMNVSAYLKRASRNGKKRVKQMVFEGESLDVASVRKWRETVLAE